MVRWKLLTKKYEFSYSRHQLTLIITKIKPTLPILAWKWNVMSCRSKFRMQDVIKIEGTKSIPCMSIEIWHYNIWARRKISQSNFNFMARIKPSQSQTGQYLPDPCSKLPSVYLRSKTICMTLRILWLALCQRTRLHAWDPAFQIWTVHPFLFQGKNQEPGSKVGWRASIICSLANTRVINDNSCDFEFATLDCEH